MARRLPLSAPQSAYIPSVRGAPLFRLCAARLVCRRPDVFSVPDICIKSRFGPSAGEKAIMIDAPYLGRLIKRHPAAAMGYHRMKDAVGKIIHPRSRRIVPVESNLCVHRQMCTWPSLSAYPSISAQHEAAAFPSAACPALSKCRPSQALGFSHSCRVQKPQPYSSASCL